MILYNFPDRMSNKRTCPPDFTPPPRLTMPWMTAPSTPSLLSRVTSSPQRSLLLKNAVASAGKPHIKMKTAGAAARLEIANTVRLAS